MKNIKRILSATLFALWLGLAAAPSAFAQPASFDSQRMDRDLQIMERIFSDLQRTTMGSSVFFNASSNSGNVTASYFPGYGVVFNVYEAYFAVGEFVTVMPYTTVSGQQAPSRVTQRAGSGSVDPTTATGYGRLTEAEEAAKREAAIDSAQHALLNRQKGVIQDFFANYVDAIGQLTQNDRISVLVSHRGSAFHYVSVDQNSRLRNNTLNPMRAEVKVSDVVAFRNGSITESEFYRRITFNELDTKAQNQKELTVMRGIFDSVLRKNDDSKFSTSRDAQGVMLTNFGVMFSLDASTSASTRLAGTLAPIDVYNISTSGNNKAQVQRVETNNGVVTLVLDDGTQVVMPNNRDVMTINGVTYNRKGEKVTNIAGVSSTYGIAEAASIEYKAELDKFVNQVADLVIDYGRTLRSLQGGDRILVSINPSVLVSKSTLPRRIEVQVDMATLRSLEAGNITRDQARQRVSIREFS